MNEEEKDEMWNYKSGGIILLLFALVLLVVSNFSPYSLVLLCMGVLFLVAGSAIIAWLHGNIEKRRLKRKGEKKTILEVMKPSLDSMQMPKEARKIVSRLDTALNKGDLDAILVGYHRLAHEIDMGYLGMKEQYDLQDKIRQVIVEEVSLGD